MLTRKMFESRFSEIPFPGVWGEILQNLMVRKRHCNISEANVFALWPGAPIWPIGVGGPRVLPVQAHSSYATDRGQWQCE